MTCKKCKIDVVAAVKELKERVNSCVDDSNSAACDETIEYINRMIDIIFGEVEEDGCAEKDVD